jgi:hypothetical protein
MRSSPANKRNNFHPVPGSQAMLGVFLPGDQFQIHFHGHMTARKAQLLQELPHGDCLGDLAGLTVDDNFHRIGFLGYGLTAGIVT